MGNKRHALSSTAQEVPEPPNQSFHFSFSNLRRRSAKPYQSDEMKGRVEDRLVIFDFRPTNSGEDVAAFAGHRKTS
jgi:hypothetical protein